MDPIQVVIIFISLTLLILIVVLSIQVFGILKEIRLSLKKINKMLDDAGRVTGAVSQTVEGMSGFMNGIKAGLHLVSQLRPKGEGDE